MKVRTIMLIHRFEEVVLLSFKFLFAFFAQVGSQILLRNLAKRVKNLAINLVLVVCGMASFSQVSFAFSTTRPAACSGSSCPASYSQPGNCPSAGSVGRDESYNIVVGGNFSVNSGAEGEGRIYVAGNLNLNAGFYNLIAVGAGACVVPKDSSITGNPGLVVGGNLNIASGATAALDGLGLSTNTLIGGVRTGSGNLTTGGTVSENVLVPSSPIDFSALQANSQIWLRMPTTGTAVNEFGTLTFTGNGTSALQVFSLAGSVSGVSINFESIPSNATVLINVVSSGSVTIDSNSFYEGGFPNDTSPSLTRRIVWNFANASQVNLTGSSQFRGSVMVPNGGMLHAVPGMNGRVIVYGDLIQNGSGNEFHNFDFIGELPDPAALIFTKAYSNDTAPSKISSQPSITMRAVCTASGTQDVTFTPPATGTIYTVPGDTCTLSETAITGGTLAGGYTFSSTSSAVISGSNPLTLSGATNSVTVTNPLVAPPAQLNITKLYSGDTVPSKVTTQPTIGVQAVCSISGTKTTSFTAGTTGTITGLVQGETCTVTETAITGGVLAGGYTFGATSAAVISLNSSTAISASQAVTITNPLTAPAQLNITKDYSGDTVPSKVTTQPTIGVQAVCSISGTKTTSFTAGTTGTITGLVQGETCTVTETAITGGVLAGGYTFGATSAAVISLNSSTAISASQAVTITNPLTAPNPAQLNITKDYSGDTVPSKVTTQPTIGVQAVCSISGTKTTSFTAGTTGTITGLVQGETCTVTETAITGGVLAGGYTFGATSAAVISLNSSTAISASQAVTITNPLTAPNAAQLN
ncbi:choice-of-anchor A family protein, partial [Undibacterium fentianense]